MIGLTWLAVVVQSAHERQEAFQAAVARNDNLAIALESYVVRTLQHADMVTRFLRMSTEEAGASFALSQALSKGLIDKRLYEAVGIMNAEGRLLATTLPANVSSIDFRDREHFKVHVANVSDAIFVGKPVISRILGRPTIPITRRVNGPDGSFDGIVIVQIAPGRFTDFYQRAKLSDGDVISITGLDGTVRARRAGHVEEAGADYSKAKGAAYPASASAGSFEDTGPDGIDRLLSFRKLQDFPLVVNVGIAKSSLLASLAEREERFRAAGALLTAVLLGLAAVLVTAFRRRDQALAKVLQREEDLKLIANHDPLTGVANRSLLEKRADTAFSAAERSGGLVACVFIDLDNFKYHNDAHGHAVGDEILRRIARILQDSVGPEDTIARIGGDEFVILLGGLDGDARASAVAKHILGRLANPLLTEPREITVTASIGISVYGRDGSTLHDLLRRADAAMYLAKDGGRSRFVMYSGDMKNRASERLYIEEELRRALRARQLEVVYQPKVDLQSGFPVGVEALVRWNHPLMGAVPPAEFIPIAEESGLILPIGDWVLETACNQVRRWMDAGLTPISVAVNVSALQFKQPEIVNIVADALERAGLASEYLELEITESMLLGHAETVTRRLEALKALGVSIALDDFGTGYSNLQSLKKLPLDTLKVDRSFISDIPDAADAASITRAVIKMGSSLGMKVVAEGVETEEQADFLIRQGCSCGQGFFYSKPLASDDCFEWLVSRLPRPPAAVAPERGEIFA